MSDISPISTSSPRGVGRISVDPPISDRTSEDVRARGGARTNDRVEISQVAQYLSQLQSKPAERTDLVNRVRNQIQSGSYLSDEKLSGAAGELFNDINLDINLGG